MPYPDIYWSDIWPGREDRVVGIVTGNDYAEVTGLRAPDRNPVVRVPFTGASDPTDALTRSYWWMDIGFADFALPPAGFGSGYTISVFVGRSDTASSVQPLSSGWGLTLQAGRNFDQLVSDLEALSEIDSVTFTPRFDAAAGDTATELPYPFQSERRVLTLGESGRRHASAILSIPVHNADTPAVVEVVFDDALAPYADGNGWSLLLGDHQHIFARTLGSITTGNAKDIVLLDEQQYYVFYNRTTLGFSALREAFKAREGIADAYLREAPGTPDNLNWSLPGAVTGKRDVPLLEASFAGGRNYPRSRVELVTTEAHRATNTNWQRVVTFATVRKEGSPPAATDDSQSFVVTDNPVRLELAPDEGLWMRHAPVGNAAPGVAAWNSSARVWDIDSRS